MCASHESEYSPVAMWPGLESQTRERAAPAQGFVAEAAPAAAARLTVDDIGALAMLDSIVAQERAPERRYSLPFRAPHTTESV
jgi:hypothetical protein